MDLIKAMFWPVAPVLGLFGGAWIADALELPGLAKGALALLGAFGGFMLVIFTHPSRR